MSDIQTILNGFMSALRRERSVYHLTLGQLLDKLENMPRKTIIKTTDGRSLGRPQSYRGFYEDLAFEPVQGSVQTAGDLATVCDLALGKSFHGYKGGDFVMDRDTPLWISNYGESSGEAIIGLGDDGILLTKNTEDGGENV